MVRYSQAVAAREASGDEAIEVLWLDSMRSPATREGYRFELAAFRRFYAGTLAELTLRHLQLWQQSLAGLAPATVCRRLSAIKSLLSFGHRLGVLQFNVGAPMQLPPIRDRLSERIVTEAAVQRLIYMEPDPRNHMMLRLFYSTGIRLSELCGLCWRDATERTEGGQISVFGKGGRTRPVVLPGGVWNELLALRADADLDDPIFLSRAGGHLSRVQVHRIVKLAAKRAKLPKGFSAHFLRHAHASHALDRGAPVHVVQQTLGHASLTTTTRYSHVRPGESSSRYLAA